MGEFALFQWCRGISRGDQYGPLQVEILYNEYDFVGAFAVASLADVALATLVVKKVAERFQGARSAEALPMNVQVEDLTKAFFKQGCPGRVPGQLRGSFLAESPPCSARGFGQTTIFANHRGTRVGPTRAACWWLAKTSRPFRCRNVASVLVFQSFALFGHMTVRENVAFGLRTQRAPKNQIRCARRRIAEIGPTGRLRRPYPGQLSAGSDSGVGFARALAPHPRLLLLDEPFGALGQRRVRLELREWLRSASRGHPPDHHPGHARPGRGPGPFRTELS